MKLLQVAFAVSAIGLAAAEPINGQYLITSNVLQYYVYELSFHAWLFVR